MKQNTEEGVFLTHYTSGESVFVGTSTYKNIHPTKYTPKRTRHVVLELIYLLHLVKTINRFHGQEMKNLSVCRDSQISFAT